MLSMAADYEMCDTAAAHPGLPAGPMEHMGIVGICPLVVMVHCQQSRILFIEVSKYVCPFNSLVDHFYLAKAPVKEKI